MKNNKKYWIHASYFYSCDRDEWLCIGTDISEKIKNICKKEHIKIRYE